MALIYNQIYDQIKLNNKKKNLTMQSKDSCLEINGYDWVHNHSHITSQWHMVEWLITMDPMESSTFDLIVPGK